MQTISMDNLRINNQRRGSLTPSSMPRILWSAESPTRDLQSSNDDLKCVNVQVVLRCRPQNEDEIKMKTSQVISCDGFKQEVTVTQNVAYKQIDKIFAFDKVFGPVSQQKELYDDVVIPIVNEVLEGYSWTIFAYGQTGAGKTYTMEGRGGKEKDGRFHDDAGVIPRAVQQIFDILESERADYNIKVTFLELYNEEITDLLSQDEGSNSLDEKPKRALVLMEDGKGAVFVRGLEEKIVCSADEIYTILEKGSAKKHTAETLLNKQSNRSHSIFSVTIQVKESNSDGSEAIKCGKLNLVDLAGSENILRSGATELRAREAGEINKSLLTLGRVINALANNAIHVPYRESKLTRLLRDSLGGKTKTCIIATISPSIHSLEETLSTLEYAFQAKSIKNRPEVNQKGMKSALVKDLYNEIDCLKKELHATRENSGNCVAQDHCSSEEATKKQLMELQELYLYQQQLVEDLRDKLESTQKELVKTQQSLFSLEDNYRQAKDTIKEKDNVIFNLLSSGKTLSERALELHSDLEAAASDISTLFAIVEHENYLEDRNRHHIQNFYSQLAQQLEELNTTVSESVTYQEHQLEMICDTTQSFLTSKAGAIDELLKQMNNLEDLYGSGVNHLDDSMKELYRNSQLVLSGLSSELSNSSSCIKDLLVKSSSDAETISNGLKSNLNNLVSRIAAFIQQEKENRAINYHTSKTISQSLLNFFKTLSTSLSKLTLMEEDSQTMTTQKLNAFVKKFEEFAVGEERLLLDKMAELLASSTSRKKIFIQTAVDDIAESASKRTNNLNGELSNVQTFTTDAEEKLTDNIERAERKYAEDTAALESVKGSIEEDLHSCIKKAAEVTEQWRISEQSLSCLLKKNTDSLGSLVKDGTEANEKLHARFSSLASSVLQETDDARKDIPLLVEYPLRLDNEASEKTNFFSGCISENMKEMYTIHSQKVVKISEDARKSLLEGYMVDDSSSSFSIPPSKRNFKLPSKEFIENLITSPFGDSQKSNA